MSNIIKGGRIRSQGILNLAERMPQTMETERIYEEEIYDKAAGSEEMAASSALIEERREQLLLIEQQINEKIEAADQKAQQILSDAYAQAALIEEEIRLKQTAMLAETVEKQQEMLKQAEEKAAHIEQTALLEKQQMLQGVEGDVVETMIVLLKHIISEELSCNLNWMTLVVKRMLAGDEIGEEAVLAVSPSCYEKLGQQREMLAALSKLTAIKEDSSLNDTTCKLITVEGNVEYDVNQGLEKVISELRILKNISQE